MKPSLNTITMNSKARKKVSTNNVKRIAVTPGEPAGIGPDIVIQLAQQQQLNELVVVASPDLLHERAELLQLPLKLTEYDPDSPSPAQPSLAGHLTIAPVELVDTVQAGVLNANNASYVLNTLDTAITLCQQQRVTAMVTAPLHKGIINDAGIAFTGHTEYLSAKCNVDLPVMMLCNPSFRVALVTTHLPLKEVSDAITAELLEKTLLILHQDLKQKFRIREPKILVCGLNPHAGEGGHMGTEEIETISPVLEKLVKKGLSITGPLPADTLFTDKYLSGHDAVLAMYHDQGLPVLKYAGFGESINLTLGLPIIRTSVDHGTALDLAGTGKANHNSLIAALQLAADLS